MSMKLLRVVAALSAMAISTMGTSAQSLSDLGPPGEPLVLSQQGSFFRRGANGAREKLRLG